MDVEASVELIAQAGHDREAFGDIYRIYVRRIYAFCLAHTRSRELAEDITSQTFERALRGIGCYHDRGVPLSHWLLRIAANGIAEHSRRPRRVILVGDAATLEDSSSEDLNPGALVDLWEWSDCLRMHMDMLTVNQQRVLRLRFWDDRTLSDVATELGCNPDAARQLLHRAIAALRLRMIENKDSADHERRTRSIGERRQEPRSSAPPKGKRSVPAAQGMGGGSTAR